MSQLTISILKNLIAESNMSRTIVIGDIHGALKALDQFIIKIAPENQDRIIFLGDYVDGWSESTQVIQYLI